MSNPSITAFTTQREVTAYHWEGAPKNEWPEWLERVGDLVDNGRRIYVNKAVKIEKGHWAVKWPDGSIASYTPAAFAETFTVPIDTPQVHRDPA